MKRFYVMIKVLNEIELNRKHTETDIIWPHFSLTSLKINKNIISFYHHIMASFNLVDKICILIVKNMDNFLRNWFLNLKKKWNTLNTQNVKNEAEQQGSRARL